MHYESRTPFAISDNLPFITKDYYTVASVSDVSTTRANDAFPDDSLQSIQSSAFQRLA